MKIPLRHYWQLIARYLKPQRGLVALLALALLGTIAFQLINPQILARFIDAISTHVESGSLLTIALIYIAAAIVSQVASVSANYLASRIGWTATNDLRADLAEHCLHLDLSFHKARTPGELIERVDGDVNALSKFFSQFTILVFSNVLLMIGVVVVLFFENWLAGLGALIFAVVALTIMIRLRNLAVPYYGEYRQQSAEFYGFIAEQLNGREDLRANGAKGFVMRGFYAFNQHWLRTWHRARFASTILWASTIAMFTIGTILALGLGAFLYMRGSITLGTVYLLYNYFNQLATPIDQIREQLEQLQAADASILRIRTLFETPSKLDAGGSAAIPDGAFALRFDHVAFRYEDDAEEAPDWVLRDLDFALPAGQVLGVLGRTGSGKSTLARLLLRLYDVQQGTITLNGVPLRATPLADLRRRVGLVTQDVQIFQATVRDNISFFDPSIPDARILETLDLLGLTAWLHDLPRGLDTPLGAEGSSLSAGEAQLLAFTRVFLKDPGLVILDEASSRLDPATEYLIERAVDRLLAERSGIIIAHRLATVQRCERILILEDGRIAEFGERAVLAHMPDSRFARLLQTGLADVLA